MKKNINGFSKLSKEKKIDWIAATYFAEPEKATQLIKSYWNADAKLQQLHDDFIENTITNFYLPLGIAPNLDDYNKDSLFDLMNGEYSFEKRIHNHYLNLQQSNYLNVFKKINYNNMHLYKLSQSDRNSLINFMLDYYRIHVYDFPEIKSLEILREMY